jgi:hypothetical protein
MEFLALSTNRNFEKNEITISGDSIVINILDHTKPDIGLQEYSGGFSISELLDQHSQDHGCIAIFPGQYTPNTPLIAIETTQLSLPNKTGVNTSLNTAETLPGKQFAGSPFSVISSKFNSYTFVYILTPFKGCSKEDAIFVYRDSSNAEVTADNQKVEGAKINSLKAYLDTWMPITINGPDTITAGVKQVYTVSATPKATVELSADIGVINRSRVLNGGNFILDTEGLNVGEVINIKTGYKFWNGLSTKTITLV